MKCPCFPSFIGRCLWLALGLLLAACQELRPDESELVVLYTSDALNYTLPYNFLTDQRTKVSMANFSTLVKERRQEYGDLCMVLDNGNKLLGTVPAGYYNYVDKQTEPLAFRVERQIGYDGVGVGRHDLELPILYDEVRWDPKAQPPVICANLIDSKTGEPVFEPYVIFKRKGIRIAVLGMVSPQIFPWLPAEDRRECELQDMIECASKWMPVIQAQKPDLVIGLCGAGYKYQEYGEGLDSYKNPNGSVPAAIRVPGFDLMLLGGSSEREIFEVCNDAGQYVTCIQTGSTCTHCGEIHIEMHKQPDGTYKKHIEAKIVNLKQYEPDMDYSNQFIGVADTLNAWLSKPLGVLGDTLCGMEGLYEADAYRQLIHRAQLWFTSADISLANCLITADTILPGVITPRTIFHMYPYDNAIELVDMMGQEVVQYLEYASGLQFETMHHPGDQLLALQRDASGKVIRNAEGRPSLTVKPINYTSAAGIRYTIDVTKPVGQRVHVLSMADGSPFDLRESYKVAINSYHGSDGGLFFSKGLGWDRAMIYLRAIRRPQYSVRYAIQEYVRAMNGDTIRTHNYPQWKLIPESLVKPAIEREKKATFPMW